ncbi:SAM-dependent methyltransferase [Actinomadura sp. DC4]|uniref:SAM-dependent methyltransferase n=1 Tax=Actinomadura sp. DC4 TaxID=3055069 RepID=UPI0025B0E6AB|nr:SAM-dependent methyltransferase [Actinomadura sp. DC4]MDN3353631.1 SAM-dependent methyltransferase [Actinomadura sp. DC4]
MAGKPAAHDPQPQWALDTGVPHTARVWNYFLGGTDNFASDREAAERVAKVNPPILELARASRAFLVRAVRHLTAEAEVRQFLDIGTGLPTFNNTHEVAQGIAPESRIVYVDNDPLVLVHAEALLTSTSPGITHYLEADLLDPETILREAAEVLDFDRPVALMLIAILHHVEDTGEAQETVRRLMDALPSGSHLAVAHAVHSPTMDEGARQWNQVGKPTLNPRSPEEVESFFDGLDVVEPGVVTTTHWRPGDVDVGAVPEVDQYAAVGRKP